MIDFAHTGISFGIGSCQNLPGLERALLISAGKRLVGRELISATISTIRAIRVSREFADENPSNLTGKSIFFSSRRIRKIRTFIHTALSPVVLLFFENTFVRWDLGILLNFEEQTCYLTKSFEKSLPPSY